MGVIARSQLHLRQPRPTPRPGHILVSAQAKVQSRRAEPCLLACLQALILILTPTIFLSVPRQSGVAGGLSPAWLQALIQALQVQACSPLTGYTPAIITPAELSPAAGDPGATPLSLASPASGQVSCLALGVALGAGAVAGPRAVLCPRSHEQEAAHGARACH